LPGSADWTHEHADSANTRISHDQQVKAPLALLWFGGPTNQGVLPRHGHGPQPQVLGGRIFIEGPDMMRAVDIYTGRLLWETPLPGLGKAFDNKTHQPGANASGSNFVSTADGIYVGYGESCLCLDPSTGALRTQFPVPAIPGAPLPLTWDYVNVFEDLLVGGFNTRPPDVRKSPLAPSSSRFLAVLDRHKGRLLWTTTAWNSFRHNGICVGNGRLFAIDRPATDFRGSFLYRASPGLGQRRLVALDLRTGKGLWQQQTDVFGTWLGYSVSEDILLESGRVTRDTLADEPRGLRALRGPDGSVLWYNKDRIGPPLIHGTMLILDGKACDLRSGKPIFRVDPLTGQKVEWTWSRTYGCNTPAGSEHLLTFRSGAAGYYDLARDGGTGNWGGFRSGCTHNLVVAGGLVTAPDYTRTCTCAYQNQTSLALVPVPEGEMWTFFSRQEVKGPIRQVGLNLGAPGCRKADNGTLWLEFPFSSGPSRRIPVRVEGTGIEWFRRHETQVEGKALPWVAASGAKGLRSITLTLGNEGQKERSYTVRLYFLEPENVKVGQRVFSVALQDKTVLVHFDVSREAGGPGRSLVREFHSIKVGKDLTVALSSEKGGDNPGPILSGIEAMAEGW
jgi:outer membrane protein assembly factor BamB